MIDGNFNRWQAVKYLKKAFNTADENEEFDPDTLLNASIANSHIYLADSINDLKTFLEKVLDNDIIEEIIDGRRETASSSSS
jgi:hypothetical protein